MSLHEIAPGVFQDTDDFAPRAIPAIGHIPFPGHRNMAQIWAAQARGRKSQTMTAARKAQQIIRSKEYGFDPESLKASER